MIKSILLGVAVSLPLLSGVMATEKEAMLCSQGNSQACADMLSQRCDAGNAIACRTLAVNTMGQCASPNGIGGCRFDSRF